MKKIFLLIFLLPFFMCNNLNKKEESRFEETVSNNKDTIFITYMCGEIDSNVAITCDKLEENHQRHIKNDYSSDMIELIDTFITDPIIIKKINDKISQKKAIAYYQEDARLYAQIKQEDGQKLNLCLEYNSNRIKINGESCWIENEAIYLLKYFSGYYYWLSPDDLLSLKELQDTSFTKYPIKTKYDK